MSACGDVYSDPETIKCCGPNTSTKLLNISWDEHQLFTPFSGNFSKQIFRMQNITSVWKRTSCSWCRFFLFSWSPHKKLLLWKKKTWILCPDPILKQFQFTKFQDKASRLPDCGLPHLFPSAKSWRIMALWCQISDDCPESVPLVREHKAPCSLQPHSAALSLSFTLWALSLSALTIMAGIVAMSNRHPPDNLPGGYSR